MQKERGVIIFKEAQTKICAKRKKMFQVDTQQKFMAAYNTDTGRIDFEDIVGWAEDRVTGNIFALVLDHNGLIDPSFASNFIGIFPEKKAKAMKKASDNRYMEIDFVEKIKQRFPDEVKSKKEQLAGLVSDIGAAHIVAREKGIQII